MPLVKQDSLTTLCNSITCEEAELKLGKDLYVPMPSCFLIIVVFYLLNSLRDWEKEKGLNIFHIIFYSTLWWHFHIYYKAIDHFLPYSVRVCGNSNSFLPLLFQSNLHFYCYNSDLRLIPYFLLFLGGLLFKTVNEAQQTTSFSILQPRFLQLYLVLIQLFC